MKTSEWEILPLEIGEVHDPEYQPYKAPKYEYGKMTLFEWVMGFIIGFIFYLLLAIALAAFIGVAFGIFVVLAKFVAAPITAGIVGVFL